MRNTTLIAGCDRYALSGLNLKINAEVKSDYEEKTTKITENYSPQVEEKKERETSRQTKIIKVRETDGLDAPLAFKSIEECSEADIRGKTNKKIYAKNAQLKSIDSKNEEQIKQWEKIYQEIEESCN